MLPGFSDPYHPHSWTRNWMFSAQLGKLMVALAAGKTYSESHSSRHLTGSDMYHFGSLIFFFFPKASRMSTPNFCQCPEKGELKYGQTALMTILPWMLKKE